VNTNNIQYIHGNSSLVVVVWEGLEGPYSLQRLYPRLGSPTQIKVIISPHCVEVSKNFHSVSDRRLINTTYFAFDNSTTALVVVVRSTYVVFERCGFKCDKNYAYIESNTYHPLTYSLFISMI